MPSKQFLFLNTFTPNDRCDSKTNTQARCGCKLLTLSRIQENKLHDITYGKTVAVQGFIRAATIKLVTRQNNKAVLIYTSTHNHQLHVNIFIKNTLACFEACINSSLLSSHCCYIISSCISFSVFLNIHFVSELMTSGLYQVQKIMGATWNRLP